MTRVLIVVFDALRPDLVGPRATPNIHAFAARGVRYGDSRAAYPTETRVNQSTVTTGCLPRRHGVVGNTFMARELCGTALLNSGDDRALEAAFAAGPVLGVPNLGQRLAADGRRLATLSAGTPGGGRLINWAAEADGGIRLAMRRPEACVPGDLFARAAARIGPLPEYALPAAAWIDWAAACYMEVIAPERPDAALLWLCEPDESFHWQGIGSPAAETAIRAVDAAFGRILAHHAAEIARGDLAVVAMSDHGQVTLRGGRLDLVEALGAAGFPASRTGLEAGAEVAVAVGNGGGLWLRDPSRAGALVAWLRAQPWCGPLFTRGGVEGTLRQAELGIDHARAPDISLILRGDDGPGPHGPPGGTVHDAPYPEGGGCHGGLGRHELATFLALGGGAFREGVEAALPAGNADILPTVLEVLGIGGAETCDGRVLAEALAGAGGPAGAPSRRTLRARDGSGPVTALDVTEYGGVRYLDQARLEHG